MNGAFASQKAPVDHVLEAIETALSHGRLDEARQLVHEINSDHSRIDMAYDEYQRLVAQIDAMAIRYLLREPVARMQEFSCHVLPTTENLANRIRAHNDIEAEMLLKMGARLGGASCVDTLRTLFESTNMPRTINYLLDNDLLPMDRLGWTHFAACFNTSNVRLMLALSKLPAVEEQLNALDEPTGRYIQAMYFYWTVRFYTQIDRDAESIRKLKAQLDTSCLTKPEILLMLQTFGDCWQELGPEFIMRNWISMNRFAVFRPLCALIERYGETKIDYVRFAFEACAMLRDVCQTADKFALMLGWLTLPLANDRLPLPTTHIAPIEFIEPHLVHLSAA